MKQKLWWRGAHFPSVKKKTVLDQMYWQLVWAVAPMLKGRNDFVHSRRKPLISLNHLHENGFFVQLHIDSVYSSSGVIVFDMFMPISPKGILTLKWCILRVWFKKQFLVMRLNFFFKNFFKNIYIFYLIWVLLVMKNPKIKLIKSLQIVFSWKNRFNLNIQSQRIYCTYGSLNAICQLFTGR